MLTIHEKNYGRVSAADMEQWTRDKHRSEQLGEVMLARFISVPVTRCGFVAIQKIAER